MPGTSIQTYDRVRMWVTGHVQVSLSHANHKYLVCECIDTSMHQYMRAYINTYNNTNTGTHQQFGYIHQSLEKCLRYPPYATKYGQAAEVRLTSGSKQDAAHPLRDSPNTSRRFARGASNVFLIGKHPTCSVSAS